MAQTKATCPNCGNFVMERGQRTSVVCSQCQTVIHVAQHGADTPASPVRKSSTY